MIKTIKQNIITKNLSIMQLVRKIIKLSNEQKKIKNKNKNIYQIIKNKIIV